MSNIMKTTTDFAMYLANGYISENSVLIDATCGNGYDTLKLAGASPSRLYAFDIQPDAVSATRDLLISEGFEKALDSDTIHLICDSHENMACYIREPADVILFNLGYLPGGDKSITTTSSSTIAALITSLSILKEGGLICITMYSGHPEGFEEKESLLVFAMDLDPQAYHVSYISMINQTNFPPEILLITKKEQR